MSRLRLLPTLVLLLSFCGGAEAKFHLFKHRQPKTAPGGQILTHRKAPKATKHKAATAKRPGY